MYNSPVHEMLYGADEGNIPERNYGDDNTMETPTYGELKSKTVPELVELHNDIALGMDKPTRKSFKRKDDIIDAIMVLGAEENKNNFEDENVKITVDRVMEIDRIRLSKNLPSNNLPIIVGRINQIIASSKFDDIDAVFLCEKLSDEPMLKLHSPKNALGIVSWYVRTGYLEVVV